MPKIEQRRRIWHGSIQKLAATPFGIWLLADNLHKLDRPILKLTGGRATLTSWLAGLPVIVVTTTGAKSGLPRAVPLVAMGDGNRIIVIASSFGRAHNPAWYYNLKAHPKVEVSIKGQTSPYRAWEAEGEERQKYWAQAVEMFAGYRLYEKKAGARVIPVMVLEPVVGESVS